MGELVAREPSISEYRCCAGERWWAGRSGNFPGHAESILRGLLGVLAIPVLDARRGRHVVYDVAIWRSPFCGIIVLYLWTAKWQSALWWHGVLGRSRRY